MGRFSRTEMIFGKEAMKKLSASSVAVFGVGGVGGYVVEALARCGVGRLDLIDNDRVSLSNINRQIIATEQTIGEFKVDAAKKRIMQINPSADVHTYKIFYMPETADLIDFNRYDYVVDAIDTVSGKIEIITRAEAFGVHVISSMGTGNKIDPTALEVADIYKTTVCPLARVMRHELKKRGVKHLKTVYSKEPPLKPQICTGENPEELSVKRVPGSNSFVPAAAGLIIAGEVVKDLTGFNDTKE